MLTTQYMKIVQVLTKQNKNKSEKDEKAWKKCQWKCPLPVALFTAENRLSTKRNWEEKEKKTHQNLIYTIIDSGKCSNEIILIGSISSSIFFVFTKLLSLLWYECQK